MMPLPFSYTRGQKVTLTATVIEDHDAGYPVLDIGGLPVMVSRLALDKADVRGDQDRLPTPEEVDLKRIREAQDAKAAAQAEREAEAEREREREGAALIAAGAEAAAQAEKPGG
jgi:hypothetical protein